MYKLLFLPGLSTVLTCQVNDRIVPQITVSKTKDFTSKLRKATRSIHARYKWTKSSRSLGVLCASERLLELWTSPALTPRSTGFIDWSYPSINIRCRWWELRLQDSMQRSFYQASVSSLSSNSACISPGLPFCILWRLTLITTYENKDHGLSALRHNTSLFT